MDNKTRLIYRISIDGILVALFLVLSLLSIRLGFVEIGIKGSVAILAAVLISPIDGLIVGGLGEFLYQVFFSGYGLTPTTMLWVLPLALRPLSIGLFCRYFEKKGKEFVGFYPRYFIVFGAAALLISLLDTGILQLDGLIMGYPVTFTWVQTGIRFLSGQATAIVVSFLIIPLFKALSVIYDKRKTRDLPEEKTESE